MAESTHNLDDLIQAIGTATDDDLRAYFQGVDDSKPIDLGKQIASPRIVTDAPHIVGSALVFINGATSEQLDWIAGITLDTLRLAIGASARAGELYAARNQALKASRDKRGEQTAVSEQLIGSAIARRGVLFGTLGKIASRVEPYASRVTAAYSKSESALDVSDSLDALVEIGRQVIKDKDPGVVARRKTTRLTNAWLDDAAGVSAKLREAGQRATAVRTTPEVTQAEVDLHDGWALILLGEILDAFDDGHQADPTIPRLNVYSLRNVLRPPSGKKPKKDPEAPAPTDHG